MSFELEFREWKGNVGRALTPSPPRRHRYKLTRSPQSFLLPLLGVLEVVPILLRNKRCSLAQEAMLRCATKGWLVVQGG